MRCESDKLEFYVGNPDYKLMDLGAKLDAHYACYYKHNVGNSVQVVIFDLDIALNSDLFKGETGYVECVEEIAFVVKRGKRIPQPWEDNVKEYLEYRPLTSLFNVGDILVQKWNHGEICQVRFFKVLTSRIPDVELQPLKTKVVRSGRDGFNLVKPLLEAPKEHVIKGVATVDLGQIGVQVDRKGVAKKWDGDPVVERRLYAL